MIILVYMFSCIEKNEKGLDASQQTQTGRFIDYYNNQSKKVEGNLIEGQKSGAWLTYDSLGLVISAEYYYKGELFKNLDSEDFNLDTIKVDSNLIITIPNNWVLKQNYKGALAIVVKEKESKEEFSPSINFVQIENGSFSNLRAYVEGDLKEIQKHTPGIKVKEKEYEKFNGVNYCTLMYFIKSGGRKIGVRSSYMNLNDSIYIVTCITEAEGEKYIEYKDLFNLVIGNSIILSSKGLALKHIK